MALTVVGVAEGQKTDGTTITITLPAGTSEGDAVYVFEGEASILGPYGMSTSGYTNIGTNTTNVTVSFGAYRKIMGASPDTTVVVNAGVNLSGHSAVVVVVRGADQTTPEAAAVTIATGSSTNPDNTTFVTTENPYLLIAAAASGVTDTSITAPTTFTNQVDISSDTTTDVTVGAASAIKGGNNNPATWTSWATGDWVAFSVGVKASAITLWAQSCL